MNITAKTEKSLLIAYGVGVFCISVYALFFFLVHKIYLNVSDAFYYMSIADSILQSGAVLNLTAIPAKPPVTPQNGIVLFHVILSILGLGLESRLIVIVVINYVLHLSATYPVYKIARRIGLEGNFPMAALLGVYAGAFHIYALQLHALNDGVFNALSIWLTYFIVVVFQDCPERRMPKLPAQFTSWPFLLGSIMVLSAILVHFRLHTLLILGAALLAAIIAGQYRNATWVIGFLAVSMASLILPYTFFLDTSNVSSLSRRVLAQILRLDRLPLQVYTLGNDAIPNLLLDDAGLPANLMYLTFALALALALMSGLRKREAGLLFISLSCIAAILFVTVYPSQTHRRLVYVFPFLYLFLLRPSQMRSIGYMFVTLVLLLSLGHFCRGYPGSPLSRFWFYLDEQHVALTDTDPLLLSEYSRQPYFLLRARTFQGELTWKLIVAHNGLFLLGSDDFVSARLTEIGGMAETANFTFERRSLTPDYHDEEGHALLQLYDFAPEARR